MLTPTPVMKQITDLLGSLSLVWLVDMPKRVTNTSATAIDNIYTNLTDCRVNIINTVISDQYGQQVTLLLLLITPYKKNIKQLEPILLMAYNENLVFQQILT